MGALTPYKVARIAEAIQAGNFMETGAQLIGVSKAALYKWLAIGRALRAELEEQVSKTVDLWEVQHKAIVEGQQAEEDEELDTLAHIRELGKSHRHWLCVELVDAIEKARAAAECRAVALIAKAGVEQWQANAWFLERTNHEQWGRKGTIQHVGPNGGAIQVQQVSVNIEVLAQSMTDAELEGAIKLVESLSKGSAGPVELLT